jgi:hypothetical protein
MFQVPGGKGVACADRIRIEDARWNGVKTLPLMINKAPALITVG